jgi:hypothetical protein
MFKATNSASTIIFFLPEERHQLQKTFLKMNKIGRYRDPYSKFPVLQQKALKAVFVSKKSQLNACFEAALDLQQEIGQPLRQDKKSY